MGRGLYRAPESPISERGDLAAAARLVPAGVVCLLSALSFHEIGTQDPAQAWIAIGIRARRPAKTGVPIRVVRF